MCYLQCSSRIKPTTSLSVSLGSLSCASWGESLWLDAGHLSKATSGPLAITCDQPSLAGVAHTGLPFLAKELITVINSIHFCILAIPPKKWFLILTANISPLLAVTRASPGHMFSSEETQRAMKPSSLFTRKGWHMAARVIFLNVRSSLFLLC